MTSRNEMALLHRLSRIIHCLLTVLLLSAQASVMAEETQIAEYRLKTAFLYNFSRFVSWPEATLHDRSEFTLCVTGTDSFGTQLDGLAGKTVQGNTLVVRRPGNLNRIADCQLVYIGENTELSEALLLLGDQPVLTVSDTAGFIEQGGMIQFVLVQNKVRFRINVDAANTAGLNISSKLLSLAISVTGNN